MTSAPPLADDRHQAGHRWPVVDAVRSTLAPLLEGPGPVPPGPASGGPGPDGTGGAPPEGRPGVAGDADAATLIVALSGGLDSVVLLHVLRFVLTAGEGGEGGVDLVAAHFDHGMRTGAAGDAAWVRGLCRAWRVELVSRRAARRPSSEDEARTARYRFLEDVADAHDRPLVLTAHHADDQAETVLFRALRGTGIEGLAGIPRVRTLAHEAAPSEAGLTTASVGSAPVLARPLLDVWREDLELYARHHGLRWRDDPTNEHLGYARNVLRHEILPAAEGKVAAGARRALVRLAEIARDEGAAWTSAMPPILESIDADLDACGEDGRREVSCDRPSLLALGPELSARVVRHLVASVGHTVGADATRRAVDFIRDSQSGRRIELGGGVEVGLDGDRVVVGR